MNEDQTRKGLQAAIRAAKLALFVIRKQGVMPNSSWEAGFERDLKTAEDALISMSINKQTADTTDQPSILPNTSGPISECRGRMDNTT